MPSPSTSGPDGAKRTPGPKSRSPTRSTTPSSGAGNSGPNVARMKSVKSSTGSPMSAKGAARKPANASSKDANGESDESKAETAAVIEDLKSRLHKAETEAEENQKQIYVFQSRLDEALADQARIEEKSNEHAESLDNARKENQELARRHRDLQHAYENDKTSSMREREEAVNREEQLNDTLMRLKENIAQKEHRKSVDGESMLARAASIRGRSSPNTQNESSSPPRDTSQNNSKLILQKDKVIESLRLELAEAQIRLVEMENAGGGHLQGLEKMLLEARMSNAKLMEDNESYQVLLSEKTLNGDFAKNNLMDPHAGRSEASSEALPKSSDQTGASLADELETADEDLTDEQQHLRKVESELSAQKDQNKALTLYINKIITRLLQSETFETLFESGSLTGDNPLKAGSANVEPAKDLRTPEAPKQTERPEKTETMKENSANPPAMNASSLLQRAGSIFGGAKRQRPQRLNAVAANAGTSGEATSGTSQAQQQPDVTQPHLPPTPTTAIQSQPLSLPPQQQSQLLAAPNQDPSTAPSVPLRRSLSNRGGHSRVPSGASNLTTPRQHRRATSDMTAAVANPTHKAHQPSTSVAAGSPPASAGPGPAALSPSAFASPRYTSGSMHASGGALQQPPPLILEDQKENDDIHKTNDARSMQSDSGYGESIAGSKPVSEAQSFNEPPSSPRAAASAALEGRPLTERHASGESKSGGSWFSGAGSKNSTQAGMRPLRLVQEKTEAEEAVQAEKKKQNRSSFMGWFNRNSAQQQASTGAGRAASPPQQHSQQHSIAEGGGTRDSRPSSGSIQEE